MDVTLTPELERLINSKVESGGCPSATEVIGEALRLLEERDCERDAQFDRLKQEVRIGTERSSEVKWSRWTFRGLSPAPGRVTQAADDPKAKLDLDEVLDEMRMLHGPDFGG